MKIQPEWIEWKGGDMPVDGHTLVAYQTRDGIHDVIDAWRINWLHQDSLNDIIAYCPLDIEPYAPQPKWWVAEKGWLMFEGKVVAESILWADPRRIADALNAAGVEL